MARISEIKRETKETSISVRLNLDEYDGANCLSTGIAFFDHMLDAATRHGRIGLQLSCKGDLEIDAHHSMEDIGLALGQAFREAIGDKRGITRFGSAVIPLDEALARSVIDISGRPYLGWRCEFPEATAGGHSVRLFREFFQAFVNTACITLHVDLLAGDEVHHCLEAIFKSFGRALRQAVAVDAALKDEVPSTKGMLA